MCWHNLKSDQMGWPHPHRALRASYQGRANGSWQRYPYRIVYRIVDDVIEVARVLHTAREWP